MGWSSGAVGVRGGAVGGERGGRSRGGGREEGDGGRGAQRSPDP